MDDDPIATIIKKEPEEITPDFETNEITCELDIKMEVELEQNSSPTEIVSVKDEAITDLPYIDPCLNVLSGNDEEKGELPILIQAEHGFCPRVDM